MKLTHLSAALLALSFTCSILHAEPPKPPVAVVTEKDLPYYDEAALQNASEYQKQTCKMDISYPTNRPGFATVVWFHGGGLTAGKRNLPWVMPEFAQVAVDYRLSPQGEFPCFLEDAAASTAWVVRNIAKYGGDPKKVFVAGHSAGGYLAAMIGMDPRWLAKEGLSSKQVAGIIPVSGQMTTHFQVKILRGDKGASLRPIIDEYAPLYYVSKNLPPVCFIVGDRKVEFKNRVEETDLMATALRNLGHPQVDFHEMGGLDHQTVVEGAKIIIPEFIKRVSQQIDTPGEPSPTPAGQ